MLRVWIGGWRHVEHLDPTKAHTVYQVEVTTQTGHYYRVERRYSAFHSLNKQCKKLGLGPLGEFPPKRIRNTSAKVLESRRKGLEYWIQSLARLHPLPQQLITFLELPSGLVTSVQVGSADHAYTTPVFGYLEDPYLADPESEDSSEDVITQATMIAFYG